VLDLATHETIALDRHQRLAGPHARITSREAGWAMSIPDHARANFQTLLRAAADGNLGLMECIDAATGNSRYGSVGEGRCAGFSISTMYCIRLGRRAAGPPTACRRHNSEC
jgi:hypothetical protein